MVSREVTVGIDVGTTSVKSVAADAEGRVLARARVPHHLGVPAPDRLEHAPDEAWRRGVRRALDEVARHGDVRGDVAAVDVAAMVPSLCAVDERGAALTPGLLDGDDRERDDRIAGGGVGDAGELLGFLRWCATRAPGAHGYWPAQAVANHALCGRGVLDTISAVSAAPLHDHGRWDAELAASAGADVSQLPEVVPGDEPAGRVDGDGPLLAPGTVDAFADQLVAGADHDGDVLVILGATLVVWAVVPEWEERPGVWTVPHSAPDKALVGGPSNAGGLFVDWLRRLAGTGGTGAAVSELDPRRVPVIEPYVRGERVPLHDPHRRAAVHGLDLTMDAASLRRAAWEASAFAARRVVELGGSDARRIVATGGGVRSEGWVQSLADATGLPVDVAAVPEGGALGAVFQARVAAGLEESIERASEWARTSHRVEPDPAWRAPTEERYERFVDLAGPVA